MSASRKKKERREIASEAPVNQNQSTGKGMSRGLKTTLIVVCAVLVVALVTFCAMVTGGFFASHSTAATVGTHKLTPAMVNYYYRNAVYQMSSYASYLGIDTSSSLDTQIYDEETGETWADVLMDQALTNAAQTYAVYDDAVANGFTLSDDDQSEIDATLAMFESQPSYLAQYFGTGCTLDSYREYITVNMTVDSYRQQKSDSLTYSADDLAAAYAEDPASYDTFTYRQFLISDTLVQGDETDLTEEELTSRKEAMASEMASAAQGDEQAFIDAAYENASESQKSSYEDESYTLRSYTGSSVTEAVRTWLADDSRQTGDTTYIDSDGTYYVLYFISRDTNDWLLPNVREIPFAATDTSDEEAMSEAKANAEAALAEYEAGEQTVEAFTALVQKYTGDETADGLTENVMPGSVSTAYEDWAFDTTRQPGDVTVVETTSGYSVLYFDGAGSVYRDALVENTLRSNDYNTWNTNLTENASYTANSFGMRFTTK